MENEKRKKNYYMSWLDCYFFSRCCCCPSRDIKLNCLCLFSVIQQDNNITSIPVGAFGKLPVVFELNLRNNQISNIRYALLKRHLRSLW